MQKMDPLCGHGPYANYSASPASVVQHGKFGHMYNAAAGGNYHQSPTGLGAGSGPQNVAGSFGSPYQSSSNAAAAAVYHQYHQQNAHNAYYSPAGHNNNTKAFAHHLHSSSSGSSSSSNQHFWSTPYPLDASLTVGDYLPPTSSYGSTSNAAGLLSQHFHEIDPYHHGNPTAGDLYVKRDQSYNLPLPVVSPQTHMLAKLTPPMQVTLEHQSQQKTASSPVEGARQNSRQNDQEEADESGESENGLQDDDAVFTTCPVKTELEKQELNSHPIIYPWMKKAYTGLHHG
jgi:hypothetical protein